MNLNPFALFREKRSTIVAPTPTDLGNILLRPSLAGVSVSTTATLGIPSYMQGVKLISEAVGRTDFMLVRSVQNRGRLPEVNHPAFDLVGKAPNSYQSAYTFWSTLITHALVSGLGAAQINRLGGEATGLHLLDPGFRPVVEGDRIVYRHGSDEVDGRDVIAIRGISWDGIDAYSPIDLSRDVLGTRIAETRYQAGVFGNGGRPNGYIELPGDPGKEQREEYRKSYEDAHSGPTRSGKVGLFWSGAKFVPTDYSPSDLTLVEGQNFGVAEVCRLLNISGWMLGVPDAIKPSSTEEGMALFVQLTLSSWFKQIQSECDCKLLTPEERQSLSFWHDTRELTRGDSRTQVDEAVSLSMNGIISPNDAAKSLGYNPSDDPRMDEPWFTTNNRQPLSTLRPGEATQPAVNRPEPTPEKEIGAGGGDDE